MDTPQRPLRPARRLPQKSPAGGRPKAKDFLGSLKIWQKLLLITAAFVVPLFIVVGLLINAQNTNINFGAKEIRGTEYLKPAKALLVALEQHLAVSDRVLRGDESALPQQTEANARVDQALADLAQVDQLYGGEFGTREQVGALAAAWAEIQQKADQLGTVGQNAFRHLDLNCASIFRVSLATFSNASNLNPRPRPRQLLRHEPGGQTGCSSSSLPLTPSSTVPTAFSTATKLPRRNGRLSASS